MPVQDSPQYLYRSQGESEEGVDLANRSVMTCYMAMLITWREDINTM